MAEGIFLLIVVGICLFLATSYIGHLFKFYALRLAARAFQMEKANRNMSAEETKVAHYALEFINKPKEKKVWTSSER
jgi:hypothetical protein